MQDIAALESFFRPESVAVVGASADPKKPGNTALRNMISMGYRGKIFPINPREPSILGLSCYKSVADVPSPIEQCVMLVAAELTLQVARDLVEHKRRFNDVKAVVCMSAGFGELNTPEATQREQALIETLRSAGIRLVGPNCLGIMDTVSGFNTNFDIGEYPRGGISVLTQSGAFGNSFLFGSGTTGRVGLNKFVSIGNMADVQMSEMLRYLQNDDSTKVVGIYLEGLEEPRDFFSVCREVVREKPIVIFKSGRSDMGSTAALSHTGSVAGADAIYDGACLQAGLIRARSVAEFYDTLRAFAKQPVPSGGRVCVLTHMGGPGTICIDEISLLPSLRMAAFSAETTEGLKKILAPGANIGHPPGYVDLTAAHYENLHNQVLGLLFRDPNIDSVIQILAPSAFLNQKLLAEEIEKAYETQPGSRKPLLNVVTFGDFADDLRKHLESSGLPTFDYPDMVAKVAGNIASYAQNRDRATATTGSVSGASQAADGSVSLVANAAAEGRASLLEPEAYEVCARYGIDVPPFRVVTTREAAVSAGRELGYPVVLKVVSAQVLHKTDIGGVMLGINTDSGLEQAYARLMENVARGAPNAANVAVLVQKMIPVSTELVLGGVRDKLFGPAIMFGLGGIYVEVLKKVGFRLAPLDLDDARRLITETLPPALIAGVRGRKKMDVEAIAAALVALGKIFEEHPQVEQVDLNPFIPTEDGCMAVDARFILATPPAR